MTQSNNIQSNESPDPIDDQLARWSSDIQCPPEQIATMWSRVSATLSSEHHSASETERPANLTTPPRVGHNLWKLGLSLAASLLIALGLGWSMLPNPKRDSVPQASSAEDVISQLAFTADELREKNALAIEFQRLCLRPVLARKTSTGWDIDESPSVDDSAGSRKSAIVIRCLLMESDTTVNASSPTWRIVKEEEVITNLEYQYTPANDRRGEVNTWFHLLPDKSLWTECQDKSRAEAYLLKQNKPYVVWEEISNDSVGRRFVVVFQCLDIDKA
jgi:hypothetical protein